MRSARRTRAGGTDAFLERLDASWIREIIALLALHLALPESMVRLSARLVEDLGAEHHQLAQLALALEESFAIDLSEDVFGRLQCVRDVIVCVAAHRRRAGLLLC
ncbi:MAG TPA: hypothetical protein VF331_15100 [Polyangiales bacterium]